MKAISLFSGMGGDSLGLQQAGFELEAYSEKESVFRETHKANFPNCKLIGESVNSDILKIKDDEFLKYKDIVDLIFAGFPCQGFSNAGKKKINDPRNSLFREFIRATKLVNPKFVIGENVKGLLSRKTDGDEMYIDVIKSEFEKLGYNIKYKVFDCEKYGIPQLRKRLIIVGIRNDIDLDYQFPIELLDIKPNLLDIVEFNMEGSIRLCLDDFDLSTIPEECILKDLDNDEDENDYHPYLKLKCKTRNETYKDKTFKTLLSFMKRDSPIHSEIIDIRKPSKTIICSYDHQPRLYVPIRNKLGNFIRCLLPDELKQIQGFPKDYIIKGNKKQKIVQIGNAVPPPLIKLVAQNLIN